MNYYIYKITNLINNKIYIGKRTCKSVVDADSYFGSGIALKKAIKKYGKQNFVKEVIEICNKSEFNNKEIFYIEKYNSMSETGYNLTKGGEGSLGRIISKETKEKMSNSLKGRPSYWKGKKLSIESRDKMRKVRLGKIPYNKGIKRPLSELINMAKGLSDLSMEDYKHIWDLIIIGLSTKEIKSKIPKTSIYTINRIKNNSHWYNKFLLSKNINYNDFKKYIRLRSCTDEEVENFYNLHTKGTSIKEISLIFNLSPNTISRNVEKYKKIIEALEEALHKSLLLIN